MKNLFTIICLSLGMGIYAQNMTDTPPMHVVQEEYLATLFKDAEVIYCKVDEVYEHVGIKNMEVMFNIDSSIFLTAFIESNEYEKGSSSSSIWCTYVELSDTSGHLLKIAYSIPSFPLAPDEDALNELEILKPILDSLLQKTAIVDYSKDTRVFLDLDEDWILYDKNFALRFPEEFFLFETQWKIEESRYFHEVEIVFQKFIDKKTYINIRIFNFIDNKPEWKKHDE